MKKNASRKEKAALALTLLTEEYLKSFPVEEQERRIRAFGLKIAELRKKSAKSSKSRVASPGRRRRQSHG
jgi:hypothetical protein